MVIGLLKRYNFIIRGDNAFNVKMTKVVDLSKRFKMSAEYVGSH